MKYKRTLNKLILLLCSFLLPQLSLANPYLFSGQNLSGSSIKLNETAPYNGGAFPGSDSFIHFSPPESYYVYSPSLGNTYIYGSNGKIVNKSIYVPQCWSTYLRVIPKDQLDLQPGEGIFNIVNYFPFISYGFQPGVTEFSFHSAEDQFIGYTAIKDPSCIPSHDPLIVTLPRYEFFRCNGYSADGFISWNRLDGGITYTLQERIGSNWYTVYTGTRPGARITKPSGGHSLRVRASAEGISGPWNNFSIRVPSCPGTNPF